MTRQRALIAQILRTAGRHLTAEEIFQLARRSMPSIAVGTVYRNLRLMAEDGELRRIEAGQCMNDELLDTIQMIATIMNGMQENFAYDR